MLQSTGYSNDFLYYGKSLSNNRFHAPPFNWFTFIIVSQSFEAAIQNELNEEEEEKNAKVIKNVAQIEFGHFHCECTRNGIEKRNLLYGCQNETGRIENWLHSVEMDENKAKEFYWTIRFEMISFSISFVPSLAEQFFWRRFVVYTRI